MSTNWLIELIKVAGVKLPLIWPYLMHIIEDLKKIAEILNSGSVVVFSGTNYASELNELLDAEADKLKQAANQSDEDYEKAKADLVAALSTLDKVMHG